MTLHNRILICINNIAKYIKLKNNTIKGLTYIYELNSSKINKDYIDIVSKFHTIIQNYEIMRCHILRYKLAKYITLLHNQPLYDLDTQVLYLGDYAIIDDYDYFLDKYQLKIHKKNNVYWVSIHDFIVL